MSGVSRYCEARGDERPTVVDGAAALLENRKLAVYIIAHRDQVAGATLHTD
jgi:hypothetical protein